ncbi:Thymidylate kinase [Porphyridium purpureum]|uniref:Thymidylate kinase n=1 Tax=Porphyridium purpureum TaxID=35688 RepID=A0A5J4YKS6_PORPP|nr:Thymidylate kinase [Porphyridium purpureum]|eukprot:POR1188..scf210_14
MALEPEPEPEPGPEPESAAPSITAGSAVPLHLGFARMRSSVSLLIRTSPRPLLASRRVRTVSVPLRVAVSQRLRHTSIVGPTQATEGARRRRRPAFMMGRGALIVFEGLDRSGKSTQAQLLARALTEGGKDVLAPSPVQRPPSDDAAGVEYVWRFPDRSTHIGQTLNTYLSSKDAEPLHRAYSISCLPRPDVVCFLSVSPEVAARRGEFGLERYENTEMQRRVRDNFERLFAHTAVSDHNIHNFDADREMQAVHRDIVELVQRVIANVADSPSTSVLSVWSS